MTSPIYIEITAAHLIYTFEDDYMGIHRVWIKEEDEHNGICYLISSTTPGAAAINLLSQGDRGKPKGFTREYVDPEFEPNLNGHRTRFIGCIWIMGKDCQEVTLNTNKKASGLLKID